MKIYLCGGIFGLTDADCLGWREEAKKLLSHTDIDLLDPTIRDFRHKELEHIAEIVEKDKAEIDESDVLLVGWRQPSVGTSTEVLYAYERNKVVIVAPLEGKRMELSPWLIYHATHVASDLQKACSFIETMNSLK